MNKESTKPVKSWLFQLLLCAFCVFYMALIMHFLNEIYAIKRLFAWQNSNVISLYFSQDIFDVFWLVLAAIPNGIFTFSLFSDLLVHQFSAEKSEKSTIFFWFTLLFAIIILGILLENVNEYTADFNKNPEVWSSRLPQAAKNLYIWLERISALIISVEISNVVCGVAYFLLQEPEDDKNDLILRIFISSIILAMYWFMIILSGISNDRFLNGRKGNPLIFPSTYFVLGLAVTFFVTLCLFAFLKYYPQKEENSAPKSIITAIVIPCIPIVIQILQIIFP